jgi:AraC-like DNA-binding protein
MFLIGPLLFSYLSSIVSSKRLSLAKYSIQCIPFVAVSLFYLLVFLFDRDGDSIDFILIIIGAPWILLISHLIFFLIKINSVVSDHQERIREGYSNLDGLEVDWLKQITWIILAILTFVLIISPSIVHGLSIDSYHTISSVFFSLILFYIAFKGFQQRVPEEPQSINQETTFKSQINILMEKLIHHMNENKPYLDTELTLSTLAAQLNMSRNQLSKVINTGAGNNFYHFVNTYRIEEVKNLIDSDKSKVYTILALAKDAGFNSKSTFNSFFKKMTGLTPSEYRNRQL